MTNPTFGKYVITSQLGSGGMAEVFLARDPMLDRNVAIKVIHPYLASGGEFEHRFSREARLVASLRHPSIVQVYEFDLSNSGPFMVMEYLEGGTLKDWLAEYRGRNELMPLPEVNAQLAAIASALDYAHERSLVHRDLKPANVLFTARRDPVITDFGIAKILSDTTQMTTAGQLLGTPAYMSPEQATNKTIDKRSDIYSLGIILYEMVTGTVPFKGESTTAVMMQHLTEPPPPPRQLNPALPEAIQSVILKALAKSPDARFASAGEMARAYAAALRGTAPAVSSDGATMIDSDGATLVEGQAATMVRPAAPAPTPSSLAASAPTAARQNPVRPAPSILTAGPAQGARATVPKVGAVALNARTIAIAAVLVVLLVLVGGFGVVKLASSGDSATLASGLQPGVAGGAQNKPSAAASPTGTQMSGGAGMNPAPTGDSVGLLRFADGSAHADQVVVTLTHIAPPAAGNKYEAWLTGKGGEARLSLGKLTVDSAGKGQLTYVDRQGANLLADFNRMEITLEPDPDPSPLPSGNVVYSSAIPPGAWMHVGHLLVAFDDTPKHIGYAVGLLQEARLVDQTTRALLDANQKNDFERVLIEAESLVNLIEGKQGQHYGDVDKNGVVSDPGDGYGLLLNGKNMGYIEGTIDHANLAANSPDATEEIKMHAQHVDIAAKNLDDWATQLRDLSLKILASNNNAEAEPFVRQSAALGSRFLNGIDLDGDETVDPVPGEAGALLAYEHAFYMADMAILSGANAMPTPGPK